jgi:hypothetical protein
MIGFWDVAVFSLVQVDQSFRGGQCHHHQGIKDFKKKRSLEKPDKCSGRKASASFEETV